MRASMMIALFVCGCFAPHYVSGDLQCAPGNVCPPGFTCAPDNRCYTTGTSLDFATSTTPIDLSMIDLSHQDLTMSIDLSAVDLEGVDLEGVDLAMNDLSRPPDLSPPPDLFVVPMTYPPAAVWVGAGGGSAVGSLGAHLNLSVGGTVVVGDITGSSGAKMTFSYFSSATQ
jgi:hypothetical protein